MVKTFAVLIVETMVQIEFWYSTQNLAQTIWQNTGNGHVIEHLNVVQICPTNYSHYIEIEASLLCSFCFQGNLKRLNSSLAFYIVTNLHLILDLKSLMINFHKGSIIAFSKVYPNTIIIMNEHTFICIQIIFVFSFFMIKSCQIFIINFSCFHYILSNVSLVCLFLLLHVLRQNCLLASQLCQTNDCSKDAYSENTRYIFHPSNPSPGYWTSVMLLHLDFSLLSQRAGEVEGRLEGLKFFGNIVVKYLLANTPLFIII